MTQHRACGAHFRPAARRSDRQQAERGAGTAGPPPPAAAMNGKGKHRAAPGAPPGVTQPRRCHHPGVVFWGGRGAFKGRAAAAGPGRNGPMGTTLWGAGARVAMATGGSAGV